VKKQEYLGKYQVKKKQAFNLKLVASKAFIFLLKAEYQERPTLRHGEKRTSKSKGTKNF